MLRTMPFSRAALLFALAAPVALMAVAAGCGDDDTPPADGTPDGSTPPPSGTGTAPPTPTPPPGPTDAGDGGTKVYCAPATYDAGDAGMLPVPSAQVFSATMAGCPGTALFRDRADLCAASCTPCSAAQWVAQRGAAAPAYHYWTNDELLYGGDFEPGSKCNAAPLDAGFDLSDFEGCGDDPELGAMPMRVCHAPPDAGFNDGDNHDALGNVCNWIRCEYGDDAAAPAVPDPPPVYDYLGGCSSNFTAGTLCCCP